MSKVLVTGGAGFIGVHCIVGLLRDGHQVRATLRSLTRAQEVRDMVAVGGADPAGIEFVAADLGADAGWTEATAGCAYVQHVASPFPAFAPKDENELIAPARDGALRLLRAAKAAGVKRVVMTSSYAAVGYGQPEPLFTEEDWTDLDTPNLSAYVKSKTIAERAAWDYVAGEGAPLELAVINPVGVFGPTLGPDTSTSLMLIQALFGGHGSALPRYALGIVDVRDVADLHIKAMTAPQAKGERFLAVAGDFMTPPEIARLLNERFGAHIEIPPQDDTPKSGASNAKAKKLLGWAPRSNEDALLASAESMVRFGLIKQP
jgi:dihydroflavonol-4-reductase